MLRILLIHNFYQQPGGEDAVFRAECALLRANGHAVETLEFHNTDIETGALGKLRAGLLGFYNPGSARRLRTAVAAFRPDVIHIHNLFPVGSPALLWAAHAAGVPVVMTLHNYRLICPGALLYTDGKLYEASVHRLFPWDAVRRKLYRNSAVQTAAVAAITGLHKLLGTWRWGVRRYITLTQFARQRYLDSSLRLRPEQVVYKSNFLVEPAPVASAARRANHLLFVGRLSPEKGLHTLLAAAAAHALPLVVVGDGPLLAEVEACAAATPSVQYAGPADAAGVAAAMRHCRALVMPSECVEGMPMVVLEAFAAGTPVLAARRGGPGEMVKPGSNGLLFEPGDAEGLAQAAHSLLADAELARRLGEGGRASYEALYTPARNYARLLSIYQEAVAEAAGSGALADTAHRPLQPNVAVEARVLN
ncbi:glycosyltransferase family 4 protein [Hymenobacter psychrotolerans]|uniref:Glycosyltransferase involved in cell wall bisynthesis n=1 Tax=Hymenobacter psychrotolerans DSM 18569 TaxID=1121959 RepID=A0A1M6W556_9BACT|nr:glycosyltransferase family 4 protein [Hymenobacter psychrotolerans]SHK88636.1 Glycosyltransferase involved in cell wall bisynthesis [Hymenobacter psychrotolerans DSM 18569]